MGANQGRLAGEKRKKKSKDGKQGGSGTRAVDKSPQVKRAVADSAPRSAPRPGGPGQAQRTDAPPASQQSAAPAGAVAAVPPPDPSLYDDHSHPFHRPLDYLREEERPLQELSASTHFDVVTLRKLQVIFTDIAESDVDDGIIDGNELTDAMGLKSSCLLARTIFRIFDITHRQKIDFATWVRTISALSPAAGLDEKINFSFSLYDLNGDGSIELEELRAMLEAAVKDENVLNLTDAEVAEWCAHTLSQVDADGDGKVDLEEYRQMVSNSTKFLESFTLDIQALCQTFRFKKGGAHQANAQQGGGGVGGGGAGLGMKLTSQEMDQRLNWFRARQRQNSASSREDGEGGDSSHSKQNDSSNSEKSGGSAANKAAGAPAAVGAPAAAATAGNRAGVDPSRTPPRNSATAAGASTSGGSAIKHGSGLHKPVVVGDPSPAASASAARAAAAAAAASSSAAITAAHIAAAAPSIAASAPATATAASTAAGGSGAASSSSSEGPSSNGVSQSPSDAFSGSPVGAYPTCVSPELVAPNFHSAQGAVGDTLITLQVINGDQAQSAGSVGLAIVASTHSDSATRKAASSSGTSVGGGSSVRSSSATPTGPVFHEASSPSPSPMQLPPQNGHAHVTASDAATGSGRRGAARMHMEGDSDDALAHSSHLLTPVEEQPTRAQ